MSSLALGIITNRQPRNTVSAVPRWLWFVPACTMPVGAFGKACTVLSLGICITWLIDSIPRMRYQRLRRVPIEHIQGKRGIFNIGMRKQAPESYMQFPPGDLDVSTWLACSHDPTLRTPGRVHRHLYHRPEKRLLKARTHTYPFIKEPPISRYLGGHR